MTSLKNEVSWSLQNWLIKVYIGSAGCLWVCLSVEMRKILYGGERKRVMEVWCLVDYEALISYRSLIDLWIIPSYFVFQAVLTFVQTKGYLENEYKIVTNFPRRDVSKWCLRLPWFGLNVFGIWNWIWPLDMTDWRGEARGSRTMSTLKNIHSQT